MENLPEKRGDGAFNLNDEVIQAARKYDLYICKHTDCYKPSSVADFAIVWDYNGTTRVIWTFYSLTSAKLFLVDMKRALDSMQTKFRWNWQITNPAAFEDAMREAVRCAQLRWEFEPRITTSWRV